MHKPTYVELPGRGVLSLSGPDTADFLQGLISQDIRRVSTKRAAYGALLTPQGKYLHDFILVGAGDAILLDCEADRRADLMTRLRRYRLRSKVEIADLTGNFQVFAILGAESPQLFGLPRQVGSAAPWKGGQVLVDPRRIGLGCRALLPKEHNGAPLREAGLSGSAFQVYDEFRARLGIPDGSRDIRVDKSTLLEANIDVLNGIDWDKGCYVGQEITARTKHRGLVKRRLRPVRLSADAAPGTPIIAGNAKVGELHSVAGRQAMALLRVDAETTDLQAGETAVELEPEPA